MKNTDFTPIIEAFIAIVSAFITLFILPKLRTYLAEKLSAEQREKLKQYVKIAVAAAEQMIKGSGKGEEKKKYVLDFLRSKGITFDVDEVTALIESEVYKLTQGSGYFLTVPENIKTDIPEDDTEDTAPDEESETEMAEAVG